MHDPLSLGFAALSDPTRRAILTALLEDDMAVTDVAAPFAMSLAAVSKHLTVLERAGLVRRERVGRIVWCRVDPVATGAMAAWLQSMGGYDAGDLDRLERLIDGALESAPTNIGAGP